MDNPQLMYEEIGKYVLQLIKQQNFPMLMSATVISYSSPTNTSIQLAGSNVILHEIKNLSNQTLAAGDLVEIVIKNGDYSNIFVAWKRV